MKSETEKIREVFDRMYSAWNEGDGAAFADCCTDEVDYVTFFGQHLNGKKEVEVSHQQLFDGPLRGSEIKGEITSLRFLNAETAVAHCVGNTKMRWQKTFSENRASINTNVLVKQDDEWKITSFQNSRIKKPNLIMKLFMKK